MGERLELRLKSPVGAEPAVYPWPLPVYVSTARPRTCPRPVSARRPSPLSPVFFRVPPGPRRLRPPARAQRPGRRARGGPGAAAAPRAVKFPVCAYNWLPGPQGGEEEGCLMKTFRLLPQLGSWKRVTAGAAPSGAKLPGFGGFGPLREVVGPGGPGGARRGSSCPAALTPAPVLAARLPPRLPVRFVG